MCHTLIVLVISEPGLTRIRHQKRSGGDVITNQRWSRIYVDITTRWKVPATKPDMCSSNDYQNLVRILFQFEIMQFVIKNAGDFGKFIGYIAFVATWLPSYCGPQFLSQSVFGHVEERKSEAFLGHSSRIPVTETRSDVIRYREGLVKSRTGTMQATPIQSTLVIADTFGTSFFVRNSESP